MSYTCKSKYIHYHRAFCQQFIALRTRDRSSLALESAAKNKRASINQCKIIIFEISNYVERVTRRQDATLAVRVTHIEINNHILPCFQRKKDCV